MAAAKNETWFVKGEDGKVFGPIDSQTLVQWAEESRIEPTSSVSRDKASWAAASRLSQLGMEWLVETAPGTFFGPFNKKVVDGLVDGGTLPKDARLYSLSGGSFDAERRRASAELEAAVAAKTAALAEIEAEAARQAETTKKTIAFMEARLAEMAESAKAADEKTGAQIAAARDEVFAGRERIERAEARAMEAEAAKAALEKRLAVAESSLADLRAQLESVTKFAAPAARKDVVEPEVVVSDAPPPKSPPRLKGASGGVAGLAALEAAARRELAAARKMGIGGIFGGGK